MPLSMMVVHTSTSYLPSQKSITVCSSSASSIWPWATAMRASGTNSRNSRARSSMDCTRLCTQNTWPSRRSSRRIASVATRSSCSPTNVRIGCRSAGGVCKSDKSRIPTRLISSVRGIGVAVSVSTSTFVLSCFIASLWVTPKRCSSSTTKRPRSLNLMVSCSSRCVPMTQSISPVARPAITFLA